MLFLLLFSPVLHALILTTGLYLLLEYPKDWLGKIHCFKTISPLCLATRTTLHVIMSEAQRQISHSLLAFSKLIFFFFFIKFIGKFQLYIIITFIIGNLYLLIIYLGSCFFPFLFFPFHPFTPEMGRKGSKKQIDFHKIYFLF